MSATILIIALIFAGGAGYFFWQWKVTTKQDKLVKLKEKIKSVEDFELDLDSLITTKKIEEWKTALSGKIKIVKDLKKKNSDELSEEEKEEVTYLPALQELQNCLQEVNNPQDLSKPVYNYWDIGLTGVIALGVFFLSAWIFGKFFGIMKNQSEK